MHQVGLFQDLFGLVDKTNGDCEVDSNVFTANYFGPCNAKGIAIKLKYNDKMPEFDANQMTVVIVHGWTSEYTKGGWMDVSHHFFFLPFLSLCILLRH